MSQVIPEAAVEAGCAFVSSGSDRRPNSEYIRQLLEAAAPHMLAGTWDAAYQSALEDEGLNRTTTPNPYRLAK